MKDDRLYVRVSTEQKKAIQRIADYYGMKISATILMLVEREEKELAAREKAERKVELTRELREKEIYQRKEEDRQTTEEETRVHKES